MSSIKLTKKGKPDKRAETSRQNIKKARVVIKEGLSKVFNPESSDEETESEEEYEPVIYEKKTKERKVETPPVKVDDGKESTAQIQ